VLLVTGYCCGILEVAAAVDDVAAAEFKLTIK